MTVEISSHDKTSEFCVSVYKNQIVPHLFLPLGLPEEKRIPPLLRSSYWVHVVHGTGLTSRMLPSGILPLHSHWVGRWGTEVGHSFETLPLVEECPGMLSRRWGLCTGRAVLQAVMKRGGDWRQRNRNRNNKEENLVIRQLFFLS